ncbi:RNP-1 like RNA-binding protein [Dissophora ornata]|nr:hypothetical protein BGZ58_005598 [Dissophora ornata]KAI8596087.1 RNP-1 like RNA-binding protein [Dissophora ornata]
MSNKLYVGSLSWTITDGTVIDSTVVKDRETGRSLGFGFDTLGSGQEADAAISGLNGKDLDGRNIKVNIANDDSSGGGRRGGGGSGGGRSGGGGGYGGGNRSGDGGGRRW